MVLRWLFGDGRNYNVDKIKHGFTKDQVREIFGDPKDVTKGGLFPEEWVYSIPWKVYVSVSFNSDGKVVNTYSHEIT